MANILDYLDWRGDLSFAASPFNEVDNYILCKVGTPDFTGILPADDTPVPLAEAVRAYFDRHGTRGDYLGALSSPHVGPMLRRLPQTERFRELQLSSFVNRVDLENTEQFSAVVVTMPGGKRYVAFRGTDDTIAAWKENFLMGVQDVVPAQEDALRYLIRIAQAYPGPLILGGHSKGGNLAVYAAAKAPPELQDRLTDIYNNDGPGFQEAMLRTPEYLRIRPKIHTILPQYSTVGTLLTQEKNCTVVKSDQFGLAAHDGFTWEVRGPRFVRCKALSRSSRAFDETMGEILENMDLEQRREFVNELFGTLTSTGAVTLTDLTEHRLRQAMELFRSLHREPEVHKFVEEVLERMAKEYVAAARSEITLPRRFRWRKPKAEPLLPGDETEE